MKQKDREKAEAIARLREWIKPGDTVYTILDHVSASGMSRAIRVVLLSCNDGRANATHPNYAVGKALDLRHWKRNGHEQDALVMGGCGMDMGFALVYELSHTLYASGYACLGQGTCPSNYHVNIRQGGDCVTCNHQRHEHQAIGSWHVQQCQASDCLCPQYQPSPELFTLTHTDGYALRHRWL